jgi:uncharacterized membrane protein
MAVASRRARRRETARETGVTATARRGVGGGFFLAARLVMLAVSIVAAIIVIAILLRVLDANASNSLVKNIHDIGKALVGPFKDLFTIKNSKVEIAVNWGLAALVWLVVGSIIARILRRIGLKSHPDRVG